MLAENVVTGSTNILHEIEERLSAVRSLQMRTELKSHILTFSTATLLSLTAAGFLELIFRFNAAGRTVLFFSALLLLATLLVRNVIIPVLRSLGWLSVPDNFELAEKIGSHFPAIKDRLLNLLQLHEELRSGRSLYSPELIDASFQDLASVVRPLDFQTTVDSSSVRKSLRHFGMVVTGVFLLVLSSPTGLLEAYGRLLAFRQEFTAPTAYDFEVHPGNADVVKGEHVEVRIRVHSNTTAPLPTSGLELFYQPEGQAMAEHKQVRADSTGVFTTTLTNLRSTTEYYVKLDGVESDRYTLTVVDLPVLRSFQVRLDYPSYTQLPPRMQDEFVGDVTALAGTRVSLSGTVSKEIVEGKIIFDSTRTIPLGVRDDLFSGGFIVESDGQYHIEVRDELSLTNPNPIRYQVRVVPDEHPTVTILEPGRNLDIAGTQSLPLLIQAKDDFGITVIRLAHRLIHSRYEPPQQTYRFIPIPFAPRREGAMEVAFAWDLSPLSLVPEDVVEYYVEVFDNDAVRGPKSGRSQTYLLRLPSLEEVFAEAEQGQEQSLEQLKQSLDEAKQLKEKLESISQDFKTNKPMDWQQQKKLEEMSKKYNELQQRLAEAQQTLDEVVQKMDQQNILSQETMEKYLELQQLFEQLDSGELQQILKQMQQAMQNVNREQLQQALQSMTFSEERFRQSIERTIELLKRIQIEQKLDEVRKRAETLLQQQEELLDQTERAQGDQKQLDELAHQQRELAEQEKKLEEAMTDLESRMEQFPLEMPVDQFQQTRQQLQQQAVPQKMQQASEMMAGGQPQQAMENQEQAAQSLKEAQQGLSSLQQQMMQQQLQYVLNEMRKATNNLLELSKRQESLKHQSQSAPPNSPQLRQNAQDQLRTMQDLGNVVRGLTELAKRSFAVTPEMGKAIGEAFQKMQGAMNNLEARNGFMASQEQGAAMSSLNKAAMEMQQAMQNLMKGGGGGGAGGLMQQLQAMAGQQQSINMQTQQMRAAAEAARLAVEQEAVRKSLEQLNREAQASVEGRRILGDLDEIAREMQEVVRNLEQNNVNPETIRKQERILSRLLDASRSMRERDFEKRRRAETGRQIARQSPAELDPSTLEGRSRLREDLLKAMEQGYARDYQELIRKYFEALQKAEVKR